MKKIDTIGYFDPEDGLPKTRQVEAEVQEYPVKMEVVKLGGGKTVNVQLGPTPGDVFAVFSKNPAYHDGGLEIWGLEARAALEIWAAKGDHVVARIIGEHGKPLNLKLEYM